MDVLQDQSLTATMDLSLAGELAWWDGFSRETDPLKGKFLDQVFVEEGVPPGESDLDYESETSYMDYLGEPDWTLAERRERFVSFDMTVVADNYSAEKAAAAVAAANAAKEADGVGKAGIKREREETEEEERPSRVNKTETHQPTPSSFDKPSEATTSSSTVTRSHRAAESTTPTGYGDGRIGAYTPAERKERIKRFLAKRSQRVWRRTIKYDCRKKLADGRPRIKGRFVKREEEENMGEETSVCEQPGSPISIASSEAFQFASTLA